MKVCIVGGAGRLGSAMAAWSAECGYETYIADPNQEVQENINAARFESLEPLVAELINKHVLDGRKIIATNNTKEATRQSDLIFIVVPTPSFPTGAFDMQYVERARS